ncbi:MAG: GDSL-type esterase/lipase family protein [Brevundimonas sp.]|nr:GDSL-type esterase/lipase family protein [Brevundimonas sp.]
MFEALSRTEGGGGASVHILQIGDSHTAGDRITGKLRAALQARFGDGGRGVLPPGVPYDGYAPLQVEVTASDWTTTLAPLAGNAGYVRAGVGLTGVQAITVQPGSTLTLRLDTLLPAFVRIEVCGTGPGRLQVAADDEIWTVAFDDGGCRSVRPDRIHRQVELRALDDVLALHAVRLTSAPGGVELSNLGVVGATLRDLAARDQRVVARELAAWRPALIVLAFGTNEGFDDGLDARAYEALLRGQIVRLRRLAPAASLMILGAPDALRNGVVNGCSADGRRSPPPSLAVVRDVQRRVAADVGVAFWDWHGRMGGDCSADRLATRGEPFMLRDRVHFNSAGSDWIGGVLHADLMTAYEAWSARRGGAE